MLPNRFLRHYDRRRLRLSLALLFTALTIPTMVVIWQAYDQLKWESWYQYRGRAEAFVNRVDTSIASRIAMAESRNAGDFAFLVPGTPTTIPQRSPLSTLPVRQDLPGVIGYFQVNPDGSFSTPLLPDDGVSAADVGLAPDDVEKRRVLANELHRILAGNRLAEERRQAADDGRRELAAVRSISPEESGYALEQQAFDRLGDAPVANADPAAESLEESSLAPQPAYGSLSDLRLDESLQRRNDDLEQPAGAVEAESDAAMPSRSRRIEKSVVPATPAVSADADRMPIPAITTFESEIDPFQFGRLRSGHFVLFRNVWRDGSRIIQGMLIDQAAFLDAAIESAYSDTGLAEMSDLVVAYRDDVIGVVRGGNYGTFSGSTREMDGSLLYRGSLSAPLDGITLILGINSLPPGPGATVLAWTTAVIALVFVAGFLALYRLGLGQIRLARQQQDFVSAVSHELKTPLTSIRMYGEMLKSGMAEEDKRQQYYEYIHDESERLTRLISNVLQLARITREETAVDLKPVRVAALFDQVRSKIDSHAERAGFTLDTRIADEAAAASLLVDEDGFLQIVINLVDNAIKFSANAATRRIDIRGDIDHQNRLTFCIRDYGPGIPPDQLRKIFGLFYRPDSGLTRDTVGTGIGLAIVQQLTMAMGGEVDVKNCDPGAEFTIAFPAC